MDRESQTERTKISLLTAAFRGFPGQSSEEHNPVHRLHSLNYSGC